MTASTRMVTLSLVMTSWGGTFMATVCRVTLRIRSIPKGSRMIRPGPLARPRTRGGAPRPAAEQPPEGVGGQDERRVAEVAEDRHLEHLPDADVRDAVLP